jgi:hypothetical protein
MPMDDLRARVTVGPATGERGGSHDQGPAMAVDSSHCGGSSNRPWMITVVLEDGGV